MGKEAEERVAEAEARVAEVEVRCQPVDVIEGVEWFSDAPRCHLNSYSYRRVMH